MGYIIYEKKYAMCLDFYTHAVFRNGRRGARSTNRASQQRFAVIHVRPRQSALAFWICADCFGKALIADLRVCFVSDGARC